MIQRVRTGADHVFDDVAVGLYALGVLSQAFSFSSGMVSISGLKNAVAVCSATSMDSARASIS